jgi:hypothetical protein
VICLIILLDGGGGGGVRERVGFVVVRFGVLQLIDLFCTRGFLYDWHWAVLVHVLFDM